MRPVPKQIAAIGVKLRGQHPEVIVNGCPLENALTHSATLPKLEKFHLKYHAETFNEEDAAKNRYEQFLVDYDG